MQEVAICTADASQSDPRYTSSPTVADLELKTTDACGKPVVEHVKLKAQNKDAAS